MPAHFNLVYGAGGGSSTAPKAVSNSNGSSSRSSGSTNSYVSEPDYNKPVTSTRSNSPSSGISTRSNAGSSSGSSSNEPDYSKPSSRSVAPSTIKYNNNNNIDYSGLSWNQNKNTSGYNSENRVVNAKNIFSKAWKWVTDGYDKIVSVNEKAAAVQEVVNYSMYNMAENAANKIIDVNKKVNEVNNEVNYLTDKIGAKTILSGVNMVGAAGEAVVNTLEKIWDVGMKITMDSTAAQAYNTANTYSMLGYDDLASQFKETGDLFHNNEDIIEHIAKDRSKILFDTLYSTSAGKVVNDASFDLFKRGMNGSSNGFAYDVTKGVVEYVPALAAKAFWGPVGQIVVVGLTTYGDKLEKNYSSVLKLAENEGREFNDRDIALADLKAGGSSIVDMATIGVAGFVKQGKGGLGGSIAVKAAKPLVNETLDTLVYKVDEDADGKVDKFDWRKVVTEGVAIVVSEIVASKIGNFLKNIRSTTVPNIETKKTEISSEQISMITNEVVPSSGGEIPETIPAADVKWFLKPGVFLDDLFSRVGKNASQITTSDVINNVIEFVSSIGSRDLNG